VAFVERKVCTYAPMLNLSSCFQVASLLSVIFQSTHFLIFGMDYDFAIVSTKEVFAHNVFYVVFMLYWATIFKVLTGLLILHCF